MLSIKSFIDRLSSYLHELKTKLICSKRKGRQPFWKFALTPLLILFIIHIHSLNAISDGTKKTTSTDAVIRLEYIIHTVWKKSNIKKNGAVLKKVNFTQNFGSMDNYIHNMPKKYGSDRIICGVIQVNELSNYT